MLSDPKITPFPYQETAIQACMNYIWGSSNKPGIIVGPTAAGKSLIVSAVAERYGKSCLVIQPSKELLVQNLGKLRDLGGDASVYSASLSTKDYGKLTYATLGSIKQMAETFKALGVDLVLIDECHAGYPPEPGSMFMLFIKALNPKKVIGFTATPFRLKASMLGSSLVMLNRMRPGFFKEFIHVIQIQDIIALNRWSPLQYEMHEFDESGLLLNSSGAEFTEDSVKKAIAAQGINNNIYLRVKQFIRENKRGILVFMDCLENARKMTEHIPNSAYLGSDTSKKERDQIIRDFKSDKIKVIFNYNILSVGFDYPELEVVILGSPTNSLALYYQRIGRVTRVHPDKSFGYVIDYCNNIQRFGKVENLIVENLETIGWCCHNSGIVLTGTPLGEFKPTIEEKRNEILGKKVAPISTIWFGKYDGTPLNKIPISYVKWTLANWEFTTPKMAQLKRDFLRLLDEDAKKFQIT